MRPTTAALGIAIWLGLAASRLPAQHLWWNASGLNDATCLYGEITVLATHDPIYYCGANWHPGDPSGGYCGIQHNGPRERRTIFSIWDTTPTLHPRVARADSKTIFNRFGGEGEGAHTHMLWNWKAHESFQFFVRKTPSATPHHTDAAYYLYDRQSKRWKHSATIAAPNGDAKCEASVAHLGGGGLASFLENFGGTDRAVAKLALYRLWLGNEVDALRCLTRAQGDGVWGQLHDAYFLAEGGQAELEKLYGDLRTQYGSPQFGGQGQPLRPISDRSLEANVVEALKSLPIAPPVR